MSSSKSSLWLLTRAISSTRLEALKTPASIVSPGADGRAVKFWISGGGGAGYFSNWPSDVPYTQTTANALSQWKVSPGMVAESKKTALHERQQRVTWDWCDTWIKFHCYGVIVFGKCALNTAFGRRFLSITEHCAPWPKRSHRNIPGGMRRMIGGKVSVIQEVTV